MKESLDNISDFLFYSGSDGSIKVEVIVGDETVWLTQSGMAEVFGSSKQNVSYHVGNILKSGEVDEVSTVKEILTVQNEGDREVSRNITFYNLDMIIAVGYRIDSYNATQFRIWATKILKEYLIKGFAMDDERLKQGKTLFGKDYFDELLQRIKEIRASERRFYQKITDIYEQCSIDYDKKSPITKTFFASVQNKLEFAITHLTAAGIIRSRADAKKPHMGLNTWGNSPDGKVLKKDITVAKNYLTQEELDELNSIVVMYLDYAELQAKRNKAMKMKDWVQKLDMFLEFNEYNILRDAGKVSKKVADSFATKQYEKFRIKQDKEFKSDFDKVVEKIKVKGELPKEKISLVEKQNEDTDFNNKLKQALNYDPKDKGSK